MRDVESKPIYFVERMGRSAAVANENAAWNRFMVARVFQRVAKL
jgi:hypothetical protein